MGYIYFDESIRDTGGFIVGAAVYSRSDLSPQVHDLWKKLGLNPTRFEYKSSTLKSGSTSAIEHRRRLHGLLFSARIGLVVCPSQDRRSLGKYAVTLVEQLISARSISSEPHTLYLDENIPLSAADKAGAQRVGISALAHQDSKVVAGLQIADLAAHSLGGMLLEEMGLLRKLVKAGEGSGYDPDTEIEIGFELWASLRYSIIGHAGAVDPDDDPVGSATLRVEGYGLYVAPTCDDRLATYARSRFGTNYLGCIH